MKLSRVQIKILKDYLNDKFVDRYVETGTINFVLISLGYDGHFEFNDHTDKIKWVAR